jgi:hypothetical protein
MTLGWQPSERVIALDLLPIYRDAESLLETW